MEQRLPRLSDLTAAWLRPEVSVLSALLEEKARTIPDKPYIVFDEGPTWTYDEADKLARGTAAALQALGVKRGDKVAVWLHDGPLIVRLALGIYYLGAVFTPINTAYKGGLLEHAANLSDAELMVADADLASRLESLSLFNLKQIVLVGKASRPDLNVDVLTEEVLLPQQPETFQAPASPIQAWDVHSIFFTSGTTGPSKAVMSTHVHIYHMALDGLHFLDAEDRYLSPASFFHIAGPYVLWGIAARGATAIIAGRFSSSRFWDQIERTGTTSTILIGAMADFLLKAPPSKRDRDHKLRKVLQQPVTHNPSAFAQRFGVEIYTQFDMTEMGPTIISEPLGDIPKVVSGYCGRRRPGFDLRLVDEHDRDVPDGTAGELIARCNVPWIITPGYYGMAEATAQAWRNGWFHTGDVFKRDEEGRYFFVDRTKDVIRRRGENISSYEVEAEVLSHPDVAAAAAYGALEDAGDGEVMITVEPRNDARIDPADLCRHLAARMAYFMVPRFIRMVPALPRSASDKIDKSQLRKEGVTQDTWDREAAGFIVER